MIIQSDGLFYSPEDLKNPLLMTSARQMTELFSRKKLDKDQQSQLAEGIFNTLNKKLPHGEALLEKALQLTKAQFLQTIENLDHVRAATYRKDMAYYYLGKYAQMGESGDAASQMQLNALQNMAKFYDPKIFEDDADANIVMELLDLEDCLQKVPKGAFNIFDFKEDQYAQVKD